MTADKVALFMPDFSGGGAERVMLTLAGEFARKGYNVDLVVTNARGSIAGDVPLGVQVVDLDAKRMPASFFKLARYLRRVRPEAMLVSQAPTNCIAIWAKQLAHVRTRLVISEHVAQSVMAGEADSLRFRLLPKLMRYSYPRADAVIAVSGGVADDLAKLIKFPRDQIKVIYNPVVTPGMLELSHERIDHAWFVPDGPPVILGVGRLNKQKDFSTLIRAFAELRQSLIARLVILGEGDERNKLEVLIAELGIQEDVELPGFVSNPYKYMRAASVFVLSSRWEGLPTVLIEALALGVTVVSTDCPCGPAEILEKGGCGFLVPVGGVSELVGAIKGACGVNDLVPQGAIRRKYSLDVAFQQYHQMLYPS